MKYLLDTHVFLWWMENKRLSSKLMDLLNDPENEVYLSVVNVWEIVIKNAKGKLKSPKEIKEGIQSSGFLVLSVEVSHALEVAKLPDYHNDPFDRILIAQAKAEDLILITADKKIWQYNIPLIKA